MKSLADKASEANGRSRLCGKCEYRPCSLSMLRICSKAFKEGFVKGYRQARTDQKEE
nr:MAG TPA: hypothetical protein [Caudoviricetes sp.]